MFPYSEIHYSEKFIHTWKVDGDWGTLAALVLHEQIPTYPPVMYQHEDKENRV